MIVLITPGVIQIWCKHCGQELEVEAEPGDRGGVLRVEACPECMREAKEASFAAGEKMAWSESGEAQKSAVQNEFHQSYSRGYREGWAACSDMVKALDAEQKSEEEGPSHERVAESGNGRG